MAGLLERRGDDRRLAQAHRLPLQLLAQLDQQGLRRPPQRRAVAGRQPNGEPSGAAADPDARQGELAGDQAGGGARAGPAEVASPGRAWRPARGPWRGAPSSRCPRRARRAPVRSAWALTAFMISAMAGPGALLHQPQVQLDDVGRQQREEGQRHRVGADVVDGDAPAEGAHALDGAQQLRRPGGEGPLGDLQDQPQLPGRVGGDGEQVVQRRAVQHLGLHVHEHRQRGQQALRDGAAEGGGTADLVQLGQPTGLAGGGEQQVGPLQRALGAAGERLVGDHPSGVELDDRLEHAVHAPGRAALPRARCRRGPGSPPRLLPSAGTARSESRDRPVTPKGSVSRAA